MVQISTTTGFLGEIKKTCLIYRSGPEVIRLFSCSAQLSMKFSLLINMKMPTIVGIFIFISRENFRLSYILQMKIVVVSNLRFISRPNFMLS